MVHQQKKGVFIFWYKTIETMVHQKLLRQFLFKANVSKSQNFAPQSRVMTMLITINFLVATRISTQKGIQPSRVLDIYQQS